MHQQSHTSCEQTGLSEACVKLWTPLEELLCRIKKKSGWHFVSLSEILLVIVPLLPPVSCLPLPLSVSLVLSFSLSVMLSSRPAFCLPLCPPWVSIPNMVILLGPYRLPPSPPLSLSLPAVDSTVQARGWEKETEKHSKKDYGKTWKGKTGREARGERKGRMMRGEETEETHSSCVSATNRVVITSSRWRIFCRCTPREQTITSDIFGQYQAVYF